MPRYRLCLLGVLLIALGLPRVAFAQTDELPYAFDQLKANGSLSFAKRILPEDLEAARRLAEKLNKTGGRAGNLMDWEVVDTRPISSRLTRHIFALHYEDFPIFLRLDIYQSAHDKHYLYPEVSRELEVLLPSAQLATLTP